MDVARACIASIAVLALAMSGCGNETASTPTPTASPEVHARPVELARVESGLIDGLVTSTYADEAHGVHADVPIIPSARKMSVAMEVLRDRALREASWDDADTVTITFDIVASGPGTLGIVLTSTWTAAGVEKTKPVLAWYDATTGRAYSSPILIQEGRWAAFGEEVVRASERSGRTVDQARLGTALQEPAAPEGDGPLLGFDSSGDMVVRFAPGVVTHDSLSLRVPAAAIQPMLSDFGVRAAAAARTPAVFDGSPAPGPTPPEGAPLQPAPTTVTSLQPPVSARPSTAIGPDCAVVACAALTYDDGPSPETPTALAALREQRAPATFFQLGQMLRAYPDIGRQVASHGQEVASHSYSHPDLRRVAMGQIVSEVERTEIVMQEMYGRKPLLFRPPYGAHDKRVDDVLRDRGQAVLLWSASSGDWVYRRTDKVIHHAVAEGARPNAIVLMHDIHPFTVNAAAGVVDGLRERGVTLVTVSELSLNSADYQPGQMICSGTSYRQYGRECRT